jgi:hypothetical protein
MARLIRSDPTPITTALRKQPILGWFMDAPGSVFPGENSGEGRRALSTN